MDNKRRHRYSGIRVVLLAVPFFVACNAERGPCLELLSAQVKLGSYRYVDSSRSYVDSFLPNANFRALDIDSANRWIMGAKGVSKFSLVLSPLRDTARWLVEADSGQRPADTLTFIYLRKLKFLSNACGYSYTYELKQLLATRNSLDSVAINSYEVTTKAGTEHVRIYY